MTSRTRDENSSASRVPSSSPYSFIADPQPAALTTMWSSSPSAANAAIVERARATRRLLLAGVELERAAAVGQLGGDHLVALGGQRRDRRAVNVREEHALNAAEEQPDAAPAFADCRRAHAGSSAHAPPEQASSARPGERPKRAWQPAGAELSCRRQQRHQAAQALGIGQRLEQQQPQRVLGARRLVLALNLGPHALDQPVVADPEGQAETHAMQPRQWSK